MIDLGKIRQLATLAIGAAKMAGADSPAFTKITGGLSSLLGQVPELSGDKVKLDAALDDAIKGRRAAGQRARDALKPR